MLTPDLNGSDDRSWSLRSPEARLVLVGLTGLFILFVLRVVIGTTALSALLFLITVGLFFVPGLALTYLMLGRRPSLAFRVPLSFILSVGVFGLPAVPALLSNWTLESYMVICAVILALSFALLVALALRRRGTPPDEVTSEEDDTRWWMWGSFALVACVFALISATGNLIYGHDEWVYLGYIRDFLAPGKLGVYEPFYGDVATFNRIYMNGWFLEQAVFSRISGLELVSMALTYLPAVVMIVSALSFYFLAKAVLVEPRAVLIATLLSLLFPLLSYIRTGAPGFFDSNSFVGIVMDKQVVRFVFLPVAVGLAVMFLRERRWQYLVFFSLACGTMMIVHPIGLVVLCFTLAGMGAGYLLFNILKLPAWISLILLALAPIVIVLPIVAYLISTGISLIELRGSIANYYSTDSSTLGYMAVVSESGGRLRFLEDGSFMLNPRRLLNPVNGSLLVGALLFLTWRVRRRLEAQMLLGMLVFILLLVYFPPLATFVGNYVGPSQIARLDWGVDLVLPLALGWMVSDLLNFLSRRSRSRALSLPTSGLLTFGVTATLTVVFLLLISPGVATHLQRSDNPPPRSCTEPVFRWIGETIDEPSVVLASDRENSCIPVYSADANVVSIRGGRLISEQEELEEVSSEEVDIPEAALEANRFSTSTELDANLARLIERNQVDYVLVWRNNLERNIESSIDQGNEILSRTDSPKGIYNVYEVNQRSLEAYLDAQDS